MHRVPVVPAWEEAVTQRPIDIRAADIDRAFVAERLKRALDQGRLTLPEYDDRLARIYAARTYGDLDQVVADLPSVVAEARAHAAAPTASASAPGPERGLLRYPWWAWLITAITIIIVVSILVGGLVTLADK
jgi:hypothetical protein